MRTVKTNDYRVLADYLTVESLIELREGWKGAGFQDDDPHVEQLTKALKYLGWER